MTLSKDFQKDVNVLQFKFDETAVHFLAEIGTKFILFRNYFNY